MLLQNPLKYLLDNFYIIKYKNPMSQHEFYSLKNYNFYDTLFFEYAQHKDGERIFKELYEYESKKLNLSFN